MTCAVTGLGNRRYAELLLESNAAQLGGAMKRMGICFIDIDHFKAINDTYGHQIGDLSLKMTANTLKAALRSHDVLARWGGEEFIAILPHLKPIELEPVAKRMCALVAKSSRDISHGKLELTVSVGGVIVEHPDEVEAAIHRADKLMYQSKLNGRNRVTIETH